MAPPPDSTSRDTRADHELVAAAACGDGSALGTLYDLHAPLLLALGCRILGSEAEAEELVHDVLLEAWRKADTYHPSWVTVRAWLVVRARSRALGQLKPATRAKSVTLGSEELERMPTLDDPSAAEDQQTIRGAVSALPSQQLEVLLLGYYGGLTSQEIAEQLEVPVGTVKSRVAAAITKLRQDVTRRSDSMSERNDLPDFMLDALGDDAAQLSAEEARVLTEALTSVVEIATSADSPGSVRAPSAGRARLVAAIAEPERFSPFVDRLAALFDLTADSVRPLLDALPGSDGWEAFSVPDVELMHVSGGPRVAALDVRFVRIAPGATFPRHRHVGLEKSVVIQGAYQEEDGSIVRAGDSLANAAGTAHRFSVISDVPLIFAVVVPGVEIEGVDYPSPSSPPADE